MKELPEAVLPPTAEWIFLDTTDSFGVHIADSVCVLLTVKGTGNVQQYTTYTSYIHHVHGYVVPVHAFTEQLLLRPPTTVKSMYTYM